MGLAGLLLSGLLLCFAIEPPVVTGNVEDAISVRLTNLEKDAFEAVDKVNDPIYTFLTKVYDGFKEDARKVIEKIQKTEIPGGIKGAITQYLEKIKFVKDAMSNKSTRNSRNKRKGLIKNYVKAVISTIINCVKQIINKIMMIGSHIVFIFLEIVDGVEKLLDSLMEVITNN